MGRCFGNAHTVVRDRCWLPTRLRQREDSPDQALLACGILEGGTEVVSALWREGSPRDTVTRG